MLTVCVNTVNTVQPTLNVLLFHSLKRKKNTRQEEKKNAKDDILITQNIWILNINNL